jgi:hypothetical protein
MIGRVLAHFGGFLGLWVVFMSTVQFAWSLIDGDQDQAATYWACVMLALLIVDRRRDESKS